MANCPNKKLEEKHLLNRKQQIFYQNNLGYPGYSYNKCDTFFLKGERWSIADSGTLLLAKDKVYHYEISTIDRRETIPDIGFFLGRVIGLPTSLKPLMFHRSTVYRELDRKRIE